MNTEIIIEKWAFRLGAGVELWPIVYDHTIVDNHPSYEMLKKYLKQFLDEALDEYFKAD